MQRQRLEQRYHNRIPVVLPRERLGGWLDGSLGRRLLRVPRKTLGEWLVSRRVNKAGEGNHELGLILTEGGVRGAGASNIDGPPEKFACLRLEPP